MWSAGSAIVMPAPGAMVGWHWPQSVPLGCGAGGGAPWHESHRLWLPSTWVHTGAVRLPPVIAATPPWQYELAQVVPFHAVAVPAKAPKMSSAGSGLST